MQFTIIQLCGLRPTAQFIKRKHAAGFGLQMIFFVCFLYLRSFVPAVREAREVLGPLLYKQIAPENKTKRGFVSKGVNSVYVKALLETSMDRCTEVCSISAWEVYTIQ